MDHPDLVLFGKHSSENANGPQLNDATDHEVLCGLCYRCSPIAMPLRLLPRMHMRLPPDRKRRHGCSLPTLQLPERGNSEKRGLGPGNQGREMEVPSPHQRGQISEQHQVGSANAGLHSHLTTNLTDLLRLCRLARLSLEVGKATMTHLPPTPSSPFFSPELPVLTLLFSVR
jgi:hypothetical protein